MQFSEDDLRAALKRKDPGPEFTDRVMAGLGQQPQRVSVANATPGWFSWVRLRPFPAMAAALAVLLLAIASWIGYQRNQERQRVEAALAEQKAVEALRITNAKLNHVFRRVRQSEANVPKVRREVL
jgi:hypothetical protein